jgi:DSBA-like thioredoxin domain
MPEGGLPWSEFTRQKFGGEESGRVAFAHVAAAGGPTACASTSTGWRAFRTPWTRTGSSSSPQGTIAGGKLRMPCSFRAYFTEGKNLNDHEQLVELATGVGLDAGAVRGYLAGEGGAAEVVASQEEAGRLGIAGVPFYVFDGRYALSGAQPVEVFGRAIDAAASQGFG